MGMRELKDVIRSAVYSGNISLMISRKYDKDGSTLHSKTTSEDSLAVTKDQKKVDTTKDSYGFVYKPVELKYRPKEEKQKQQLQLQSQSQNPANPFKTVPSPSQSTSNQITTTSSAEKARFKSSDSSNFGSKILEEKQPDSQMLQNNPIDQDGWYQQLGLLEKSATEQSPRRHDYHDQTKSNLVQQNLNYKLAGNIGVVSDSKKINQEIISQNAPNQGVIQYKNERNIASVINNSNSLAELEREEMELKMAAKRRAEEEEETRKIFDEQERQTLAIQRMELEAKEAEQKARFNRQRYEHQMKRIDDQLREEEERLRIVKEKRLQVENAIKQPYNYEDYRVVYPNGYNNKNNNNNINNNNNNRENSG